MFGLNLTISFENDTPRQRCYISVNLGIEEIAQADEAAREGHGDDQMVHYPEEVKTVRLTVSS